MIRIFLITLLLQITINIANAQVALYKTVNSYNVVAQTDKDKVKGILKQATDSTIIIQETKQTTILPIDKIKSLKIKFAKQNSYKVYDDATKAGLDIMVNNPEPPLVSKDIHGNTVINPLDNSDNSLQDMGKRALVGATVVGLATAGNELTKLFYRPSIETFKIKKDYKRYEKKKFDIQLYSEHLQLSPDYENILLKQLQEAISKNRGK